MAKIIWIVAFLTLGSLASLCQGLKCYTCANVKTGKLVGFDLSPSCEWGNQPEDKFLQKCETDGDGDKFQHTCAEMYIKGWSLEDVNPKPLEATVWGCATKQKDSSQASPKECLQGRLDTVSNHFRDTTGREFLQHWIGQLNSNTTSVKFCACATGECWEDRLEVEEAGSGASVPNSQVFIVSIISTLMFFSRFY